MSDSTPAPVRRLSPPTRTLLTARWLWLASLALGLIAGFFIFIYRADQIDRLQQTITELDATRAAETVDALSLLVFWGALGILALVLVLEAIMLSVMLRGHGGARWALLFLLVLNAGAVLLADAVLLPPEGNGPYLWLLLIAQFVLAGAGFVCSLLPGSSGWFRAQHGHSGRMR
ncbi:hypothetical protein [Cryobacterium sp. BB736]|uniref:hypothetical protein n=1 Tax=Cryobacterium sp. BB736 TaxID=2746963 RepID=UPI001D0BF3F6|nr:hypothetical protein [Cryobacterium sp. BB736]